nr:hypothetical protein Iba_chr14fCG8410 [Ipomoea batatas]
MPRVVISSPSQFDSTETEESSSSEDSSLPAEESSIGFGGFVHQLFADPSGFPSHLPASPAHSVLSGGPNSPSFSPLARGPGDFEDVELFPSQPSILKESDLSLVRSLLGPSAELSPNSFRFVASFLSLCDSLSIPPTLSHFTQLFYIAAVGSRSPGSIQIIQCEGLHFLDGASGSGIPFFDTVGPSAPISSLGAIPSEMASRHDLLQGQFRRLTRSHTARSATPPPLPTEGPCDNGKKPVDGPSDPPAFASSPPPCALVDSGALRKQAKAEPVDEELSSSLPQPLTLVEHMQTISEEALHRRTVANLYRAVAAVSTNRRCSQELEELNAHFSDLNVRYQDQVEASHRSLTTQVELRRARREAEEGRRVAEESLLSAVSDYQNSYRFRQDALASIRRASDDFALIVKDWLASSEETHPLGFALSYDSCGRHEIPFDHAYLNSAANLQALADLSNAEISLGPLDNVDGTSLQDVRGDVSSQAPGV